LGVLVAGSDALDQYVVRHPEFFLQASPEQARIAPDQKLILFDQLRCAAFELPFRHDECFGGQARNEYLAILAEDGVLHRDGDRYHWIDDSYPAQSVNLRSVADGNFVVVDLTDGQQNIIAEVDYTSAALTLYEGAIYLVQSQPWQVERLDWVGRKAFVTRTRADYYTDAIDYTRLKPLDSFARQFSGDGEVQHGEVHVVRRVTGYKKIRYYTHENIGYGPVSLPDQELQSTAVWWTLPAAALDAAFADRQAALDGFLGAARVLQTVALVAVLAERRDLCRAVAGVDGDSGVGVAGQFQPTLYLYDNYPGGIGLSEPLFRHAQPLLQQAHRLLQQCSCTAGCPACVGPVLEREERGQGDSKAHALRVLSLLLDDSLPGATTDGPDGPSSPA
ncbi:MAG: DUF1998 domain-containing protein, partial [Xanthomonadales bacterium]|nr:DUF1998 domain-containing protein [Xanthomonadales bacterium]